MVGTHASAASSQGIRKGFDAEKHGSILFWYSDRKSGVIGELMKHSSSKSPISRRQFLAVTGAALAAPAIIPGCAVGRGGATAPSERVTLGVVGWGMQGPSNTNEFLRLKDCQVVAACDLDKHHLDQAVNTINKHYQNQDCKPYHDYREMMARMDIDAVMIAVPDHWHALLSTEAARHKKDI